MKHHKVSTQSENRQKACLWLAFELFRSKTLLSLLTYELTQNGHFFPEAFFPRSLFPRILYAHRSKSRSVLIIYVQKSSVDNSMTLLSTKLPQWILEDVALLVGRGHRGCSDSLPGHGRDDHLCGEPRLGGLDSKKWHRIPKNPARVHEAHLGWNQLEEHSYFSFSRKIA